MSELSVEEKEAINNLRFYSTNVGFSKYDGTACLLRARDVQILLNLLGKQHQELEQEKEKNKNTGKLVENKIDGTIGIVLREWDTGQIQVLENIQPKIINTHDSWETLELLEEAE